MRGAIYGCCGTSVRGRKKKKRTKFRMRWGTRTAARALGRAEDWGSIVQVLQKKTFVGLRGQGKNLANERENFGGPKKPAASSPIRKELENADGVEGHGAKVDPGKRSWRDLEDWEKGAYRVGDTLEKKPT